MEPQLQLSLAGMQRVMEIPIPAISLPHFNIPVCWFHPQHSSSSAFLSSLGIGTLNSLALTRCVWLCCSNTLVQLSWRYLSPREMLDRVNVLSALGDYGPWFPLLLSHSQAQLQSRL